MKKLSFESGNLVIRDMDGFLCWSSHWIDMKGSYEGEYMEGGYKEILIEGFLIEKHDYAEDKKIEL